MARETATLSVGFGLDVPLPYEEAIRRVTAALKKEDFGVLTEIDVKATMKQKLDIEVEPYAILGACNPPLAHRALTTRRDIGLLLPCNVIVYATGSGGSRIEFLDPVVALDLVGDEQLRPIAEEARARLARVAESLAMTQGSSSNEAPVTG